MHQGDRTKRLRVDYHLESQERASIPTYGGISIQTLPNFPQQSYSRTPGHYFSEFASSPVSFPYAGMYSPHPYLFGQQAYPPYSHAFQPTANQLYSAFPYNNDLHYHTSLPMSPNSNVFNTNTVAGAPNAQRPMSSRSNGPPQPPNGLLPDGGVPIHTQPAVMNPTSFPHYDANGGQTHAGMTVAGGYHIAPAHLYGAPTGHYDMTGANANQAANENSW